MVAEGETMKDETKTETEQSSEPKDTRRNEQDKTRRTPSRKGKIVAASLLLIFLCFVAGLGGALLVTRTAQSPFSFVNRSSGTDGNKIITQEEEDIASVASKVAPSVGMRRDQRLKEAWVHDPRNKDVHHNGKSR